MNRLSQMGLIADYHYDLASPWCHQVHSQNEKMLVLAVSSHCWAPWHQIHSQYLMMLNLILHCQNCNPKPVLGFYVYGSFFGLVVLLEWAALFQRWIAGSGLNSLTSADSKLILIRAVTASSVKQFCQSVLVILSKENPLSHSEECAGIVSSKSINRRKFGAILLNAMLICSQLTSFPIFLPPYLKM